MRDPTGKLIQGRTRWRRFLIILGPAMGIVALMMYLVATGVLAMNLAISGMPFRLSASSLTGDKFVQFAAPTQVTNTSAGDLVAYEEGVTPNLSVPGSTSQVAGDTKTYLADTITLLQNAHIGGLHQTVCAPLPAPFAGFWNPGALQVTIDASGTATADSLVVQAPAETAGSATFTNIIIGQDASSALSQDSYPAMTGTAGLFAQAADSVSISNLNQIAVGTEAGSFTLPGLSLSASFVASCP